MKADMNLKSQTYNMSRADIAERLLRNVIIPMNEFVRTHTGPSLHGLYLPRTSVRVFAVPRGGIFVVHELQLLLQQMRSSPDTNKQFEIPQIVVTGIPEEADFIVDDIIDSGATMKKYMSRSPSSRFLVLVNKQEVKEDKQLGWVVFPWEDNEAGSSEDIFVRLLQFVGEDPKREGLRETPIRMAKAWKFWTSGYAVENPGSVLKVFSDGAERCDQMVSVNSIPFYSNCEHHLAPFFGYAHVAYIPDKKIIGLSKISRLVDIFSRRLQVQERLTSQIADTINDVANPRGVAVCLHARHMCIESRGVCRPGEVTTTSALRGLFLTSPQVRSEFYSLANRDSNHAGNIG